LRDEPDPAAEKMLRAILRRLAENERALNAARSAPAYERAWTDPDPLVSVTVATIGRPELTQRALPSILAQSHRRIEVIVVGDGTGAETADAVASLGDERVHFHGLEPEAPWTDDLRKRWLVGATRPRNAAVRMATGAWIVQFDDDDEMRSGCLDALLGLARAERAEAVYGRISYHRRIGRTKVGRYPPTLNKSFSWVSAMYHSGLRFFERELVAAELDLPGDWWLAERMLRAGVRFAMHPEILCDVYPAHRGGVPAGPDSPAAVTSATSP
jgi:glycosyltransferase involved in cell wall biosynthesis